MPESAPLNPEQRAWLSGFVSGLLDESFAAVARAPMPPGPSQQQPQLRPSVRSGPIQRSSDPAATRIAQVVPLPSDAGDLYAVELDGNGALAHDSSDAIAIWPQNDPEAVRQVLRLLGVRGQALVETPAGREPAWRALLERFDLGRSPVALIELLAHSARSTDEAATLRGLAPEPRLGARDVAGLLRRFPSARPSLRELLGCLRPLTPSVHPLASARAEFPRLTFAARIARRTLSALDLGVAEKSVATSLRAGEWLNVNVVSEPRTRIPDDLEAPILLAVEGSGLARARACVAERAAARARGRTWLLCATSAGGDYAFREAFEQWRDAGVVTRLSTSEGTLGELIAEHADAIWRWLVDRSLVVVSTPRAEQRDSAVDAFVAIHQRFSRLDAPGAQAQLAELAAEDRWLVHDW